MNDIFEAAKRYYEGGFNVVAVKYSFAEDGSVEKKPLTEWSEWRKRRQTREEFEAQNWAAADGFAVVLGYPNKDGLYLAVVDRDKKKISEEAFKAGWRYYKQFPPTRIEGTINGGEHKIYLTRVPAKSIGDFHEKYGLELLGLEKICVMAPSKGYTVKIADEPTVVEDIQGIFESILGIKRKENINVRENQDSLLLEKVAAKINVVRDMGTYILAHCPFHPPDNHPSFAIYKNTGLAVDFHTGERLSIKELAERLGLEAEKERLRLKQLAEQIIRETPIKTDRRSKLMYRWNGRYWTDDAESIIQEKLVEAEGDNYKPYHLTALTEIIQGLTFVNGFEEPPANLINFENGVLNINTFELKPHSPDYFFRNIIHAEYRPEARAPKFLKWLEEILPDEDSRLLIQEIAGYCLYRGYPIHKMFFFVGSGRNGKGTLMRTLISILGRENCANIPLERLGERFQVAGLIGKLANIVSEPKTSHLMTEIVKALTGEDLISAEIKGKQKFVNFVNYAKLVVLANRLPPVRDSTNAWWERVTVLEFPVSIPPEKQVPNIEETWLNDGEERSGIINWALEGLKRLLKNKRFTETEALKQSVEEYKKWSAPAEYFIMNYCIIDGKSLIPKRNLYEVFKEVCEAEGLSEQSERSFAETIKRLPRVKEEVRKIQGKAVKCWVGLRLREEKVKELLENNDTVTGVTEVTDFSYSRKSSEKVNEEIKEEREFFSEFKKSVTPVTSVTFGVEQASSGRRIDINRCGDCRFYEQAKCLLRRDWVSVMPVHPACEWFEPKGAAGS